MRFCFLLLILSVSVSAAPLPLLCAFNLTAPDARPEQIVEAYAKLLEHLKINSTSQEFDKILVELAKEGRTFSFTGESPVTAQVSEALKTLEKLATTHLDEIRGKLADEIKKSRGQTVAVVEKIKVERKKTAFMPATVTEFKPPKDAETVKYIGQNEGKFFVVDKKKRFYWLDPLTAKYKKIEIPGLKIEKLKEITASKDMSAMIVTHEIPKPQPDPDIEFYQYVNLKTKEVKDIKAEWIVTNEKTRPTGDEPSITNVVLSPDGKTALISLSWFFKRSTSMRTQVQLMDIATGKVIDVIEEDWMSKNSMIYSLGMSENGEWLWFDDGRGTEQTYLYRKDAKGKYKKAWASDAKIEGDVSVAFIPGTHEPVIHLEIKKGSEARILTWNGKKMAEVYHQKRKVPMQNLVLSSDGQYAIFGDWTGNIGSFSVLDLKSKKIVFEAEWSDALHDSRPVDFYAAESCLVLTPE